MACLDVSSVSAVPRTFVDPELRAHLADVIFRVALRGGGEAFVYVLIEHKSHPDRWVAFQLLRYVVRLWEQAVRVSISTSRSQSRAGGRGPAVSAC